MRAWGILAAAGSGARLGSDVPKAFVEVRGRPMLLASLSAMFSVDQEGSIVGVVIAVPAGWEDRARALASQAAGDVLIVTGGDTRQASVRAALALVPEDVEAVVVHDAARPDAGVWNFEFVLAALKDADGALCATPAVETVKRVSGEVVLQTLPREEIWTAHTPQAFRADLLREAHAAALADGFEATDDAALMERIGCRVVVVRAFPPSRKITTRDDLAAVSSPPSDVTPYGVGTGSDAHALVRGRPLALGGVTIPFEKGLDGHSDADVLCHAVCDALLGGAGLGDLGRHFPSDDPTWKGVSGTGLLRRVAGLLREAGRAPLWIDATIIIERPKMAPYIDQMRRRIADAVRIDIEFVSVKATTTDGLGMVGRGEGAAAQAVALVR